MPACVNCKSENTVTCSLAYSQGTSNISATSKTYDGNSVGSVQTTGTAQTQEAQVCAPPAKVPYVLTIIGILGMGLIIGLIVGNVVWPPLGIFIFVATPVVLFFFLKFAWNFNNKDYPKIYEEWTRKWLCRSCGTIFIWQ